jgi:hypothetical protein
MVGIGSRKEYKKPERKKGIRKAKPSQGKGRACSAIFAKIRGTNPVYPFALSRGSACRDRYTCTVLLFLVCPLYVCPSSCPWSLVCYS